MKIVAGVFADFERTFLGRPSRLRELLGSRRVIHHTLRRLARIETAVRRLLVVRPRDERLAAEMLSELHPGHAIELLPIDPGARLRSGLTASARKWSLESWRGGLLGSTGFDEFVDAAAVAAVLNHTAADALLCFDGHHAALDPALASAMMKHQAQRAFEAGFVFSAAPPGLCGMVLTRRTTQDLLNDALPVGLLLSYRPEFPGTDPLIHPTCFHVSTEIFRTKARFAADTRRSSEQLKAAFDELGEDADAAGLCAWVRRHESDEVAMSPTEIEVELTTRDPLPETRLLPRGRRIESRELVDLDALQRRASELAEYDDSLMFLGGHGDPLLFPQLPEACARIRAAGVCGLGIQTTLVELPDACVESLFAHRVDVLQVRLDAATPASYVKLHGVDAYDRVLAHVQRIERERVERQSPQPLIVPTITRFSENIEEIEAFFDGWIRRTGSATIVGYNDYCGALPHDSLLRAAPPVRGPCLRLGARLMFLADGRVPRCSQDFRGEYALGDWRVQSLPEIWSGEALRTLRAVHQRREGAGLPLCESCGEWFRP